MAKDAFFMSHETYTPARGGSAAGEVEALNASFGPSASEIVIANTKGYTGHAMGAGIEDAVAVKGLQYGVLPPIANLKEPDEALGDLKLSTGEHRAYKYAIRLAAGFGSQLALSVWKAAAKGDARVPNPAARTSWLKQVTGFDHVEEFIDTRVLRIRESETDTLVPLTPDISPMGFHTAQPAPTPTPPPVSQEESPSIQTEKAAPVPQTAAPPAPSNTDTLHTLLRGDEVGLLARRKCPGARTDSSPFFVSCKFYLFGGRCHKY